MVPNWWHGETPTEIYVRDNDFENFIKRKDKNLEGIQRREGWDEICFYKGWDDCIIDKTERE